MGCELAGAPDAAIPPGIPRYTSGLAKNKRGHTLCVADIQATESNVKDKVGRSRKSERFVDTCTAET